MNKIEARNTFLANLENNFSKIEGSFNFDIASAYGIEAESIYKSLEYGSIRLLLIRRQKTNL